VSYNTSYVKEGPSFSAVSWWFRGIAKFSRKIKVPGSFPERSPPGTVPASSNYIKHPGNSPSSDYFSLPHTEKESSLRGSPKICCSSTPVTAYWLIQEFFDLFGLLPGGRWT